MASLISKFYLITRNHKGWSPCCNISQLPFPNSMGCVVPFHQVCDPHSNTHKQIPIPLETQFTPAMGYSSQITAVLQSELLIKTSPGLAALALCAPHSTWGQEAEGGVGSGGEDANKSRLLLQYCSLIPTTGSTAEEMPLFPTWKICSIEDSRKQNHLIPAKLHGLVCAPLTSH